MRISLPLVRLGVLVAGFAVALGSPTLSAQQIQGELVEQGTGAPVAGAFVVLLDPADRQVDMALTDPRGRFALTAPVPGNYTLGLDRIGYLSTKTDPIPLAEGQVLLYRLSTVVEPVELDDIDVAIAGECEVHPAEGETVSRVWQEARKALNATAYTQRLGLLEYVLTGRERELDPFTLESRRETAHRRRGVSRGSPYVALPIAQLARQGFVQAGGDTVAYFGPDATTLLSDWFADAHCFRLRESNEEPGRIGLTFEPVPSRRLPDIRGTLWIDRRTAELRRLDYEYTGLPRVAHREAGTGRIEFERLPSGEWIIRRWWIRMPIVRQPEESTYSHITMDPNQRIATLVSIEEESGEVSEIVSLRAEGEAPRARRLASEPLALPAVLSGDLAVETSALAAPATGSFVAVERRPGGAATPPLSGRVRDFTTGLPLPGAQVALPELDAGAVAGPDGRFGVAGIPAGKHRVVVEHLGYATAETDVAIEPDQRVELDARLAPAPIAVSGVDIEIPGEDEPETRGMGEARYVVRSRDIPTSTAITVGDVIQRFVPGARVRPGFCPQVLTRGGPVGMVVIDHQTFRDTCVLNLVEPAQIETLELLPSSTAQMRYGPSSGGGVIVVTTKHGKEKEE